MQTGRPHSHGDEGVKVGVVGLGSMGFGIARSLVRSGFTTYGFDVDSARLDAFVEQGGQRASPAELSRTLDALVFVVVDGEQMREALFGEGGALGMVRRGGVVMGCPTITPDLAKTIERRLSQDGILYLDAPISGGTARAAEGSLTVMASGRPEAMTAARPFLDAMADTVFELGDAAGPASVMKMINQLLAGVHIAAAGEAIAFAASQGIAPQRTLEVISKCAGTSWMFENRGAHIAQGDYAPRSAVDIFIKDLGIVSDVARSARFSTPLAATALQQFVAAGGMGLGREDDAAVAKVYARNSNIQLPGDD